MQQNGFGNTTDSQNIYGADDSEPEDDAIDQQEPKEHVYIQGSRSSRQQPPAPMTLHFYPRSWKMVLNRAMDRFAWHVFLNQGFLVCSSDLSIAQNILYEEIAKGKAKKLMLELCNPQQLSHRISIDLTHFLAYKQTCDMDIVVYHLLPVIMILKMLSRFLMLE